MANWHQLLPISEQELRSALRGKLESDLLVSASLREEMHIEDSSARIDLAVIGSLLEGYEIKSDYDTLTRLGRQSE